MSTINGCFGEPCEVPESIIGVREEPAMDDNEFGAYVAMMDDEIREAVHADMAPCTNDEFLAEYQRRHAEKYGAELTV